MDIREIFENYIKIEPKVMSIESLFNNEERLERTDYQPFYQRNYVWDDEKATYFIESILLGTEIPPLIYFRNASKVEVIDGRQRYQTILRFIKNEFKLRRNGLHKLENSGITNKYFKNLDNNLIDLFWDTKLRLIEFSFNTKINISDDIEERVKKEIFKRYNSGITPLKPSEIDKAAYYEDDLNTHIKSNLLSDAILLKDVSRAFNFEKIDIEVILKKIRQLLVQHHIPIKYYAIKKDSAISKYYEYLFSQINQEEINNYYNSFIKKINLLNKIKNRFEINKISYNRLIAECLYWSLSVIETEKFPLNEINSTIIEKLADHIKTNIGVYSMIRSSFAKELLDRYSVTALFFENQLNIDFKIYLQYTNEFKQKNKELGFDEKSIPSFSELRINKPEPSSTAIADISRQMKRQRFLIRPPYQRNEVINKKKSSSIIESILLGIKLPPIFVFKRSDGISEVLDGQQRLLSILGFIGESYMDENNNTKFSDKNNYALNLKNSILSNLNQKKFTQLEQKDKDTIKNFDLWIIEINQNNNKNFEPIDLFIRLNNKPYPIKEDTFEMWNSYITREIILIIKNIHKKNKEWFYYRKNNTRMEDENIYTALAYYQYLINISTHEKNNDFILKHLDVYKVDKRINFRIKSKNEITKTLENIHEKENFIRACNDFELIFIKKLKDILIDDEKSTVSINKNLDYIFNVDNGRRTQQGFYALWYFIHDINIEKGLTDNSIIRKELRKLFEYMSNIESKSTFFSKVNEFKKKYKFKKKDSPKYKLGDFSVILNGNNSFNLNSYNIEVNQTNIRNEMSYTYFKTVKIYNYKIDINNSEYIKTNNINQTVSATKNNDLINDSKVKILIQKETTKPRINACLFEEKYIFNTDYITVVIDRLGICPEYILGIITSSYVYKSVTKNDNKSLNITQLKDIDIPIISIDKQILIKKIVQYIIISGSKIEQVLFYERIIDCIVYDLFHPNTILDELLHNQLQNLIENTYDSVKTNEVYRILSDPSHRINVSLINLIASGY